jgi:L-fuculose-phosphate aldolase
VSRFSPYLHPADEILLTMERIYRHRMTTTSGGNLSLVDGAGHIWITPAGVDKGGLERDDIVCVRPDGTGEGSRRPSSELPFHRMIYAARPDLRGIVHAHAGALVAFSIAHRVPDTRLFHQSRGVCGEVGLRHTRCPEARSPGSGSPTPSRRGFHCVVPRTTASWLAAPPPGRLPAVRDARVRGAHAHPGVARRRGAISQTRTTQAAGS